MAVSMPHLSLPQLQDLFYRCKFAELLEILEKLSAERGGLDAEHALLKANTLFEQHHVSEARETLKSLSRSSDAFDEAYLYALARTCYLDERELEARSVFQEIYANTQSPTYRFKSLLGIANTYYSQSDYARLPPIIDDLLAFEPLPRDDERISLMIFLGNYYLASQTSHALAKEYFKKALSHAAANTWTYFVTRSLYGIASVCEQDGQSAELMWTLEILQAFVDQSQQRFFSYVVNKKFKNHYTINTPMEFDTANKRLMIKNRWLPFHEKPLLFQFLLLLHNRGNFVGKEAIAQDLWPDEDYKPRLHDPRIFDIAKRARQLIEAYENQPVVLLSGRMGYKLAST
jgi:hypothetical protein